MTELDYNQRKALRRLARNKTINRSMRFDPIIKKCISTDHYIEPPDIFNTPYPQCMIEWCDWEDKAYFTNRPRINEYGKQLLAELEASNGDS